MAEAGLTSNGLPDSEYSGWQLYEALKGVFGGTRKKVIPIGTWNMDTTASINVAHGLTLANIRAFSFVIIDDAGTGLIQNGLVGLVYEVQAAAVIGTTNCQLERKAAGIFDNSSFSGSANRGYFVIDYVE